jgi:hypothetical protein
LVADQRNGFPAHPYRMGLATSDAMPNRLYVLADGPPDEAGMYVSNDGGAHWTHATGDKRIWERGWYFSGITADPKNADRIFVMDTIVLRSDDAGKHFIALKGDPTGDDFHALWIDPTDSDRQILGSDQGTQITANGGKTWSSWYNQPTAQIYHVATDNRFPYWVYGAQQDSGAVSLPSRTSTYDGITMEQFHEETAGGESGMIAPDPDDPDIVYGEKVRQARSEAPGKRAMSIPRSLIRRRNIAAPGPCRSRFRRRTKRRSISPISACSAPRTAAIIGRRCRPI